MHADSQSVFDYIFGLTVPGVKLELSRVQEFMNYLGQPYNAYPIIHIAGTNGKGSTAAMMAAILGAYKLKTGLFTSPHLVLPNERIKVGDDLVPDDFIIQQVNEWRPKINELGITFFEVLTALGFQYFRHKKVDIAVLETGLGGRLDATNVVNPLASVITAVSMDHENILGNTIEQIAGEKAGIVKAGKPVILGKNAVKVHQIIQERSKTLGASFTYVPDVCEIENVTQSGLTQRVTIRIREQVVEVRLPLLGLHQVENFCNVLVTLSVLGYKFDSKTIQYGLDNMQWWGRLQPLQVQPLVLYDVAHNLEGLERLLESLETAGMQDAILIAAFNARKSIQPMLDLLQGWSGQVIYSSFEGHSAVSNQDLLSYGIPEAQILGSLDVAYAHAQSLSKGQSKAVCFFGSHYLAEALYEMFGLSQTKISDQAK